MKEITKKRAKRISKKIMDGNFAAIKSRFWGILNNIKEELKLRKITRKIKSNKEIRNINKRDRKIKNRGD